MTLHPGRMAYRIRELNLLLRAVLGCKQIAHCEEEQEQLYCTANRVILIARLDVADSDGGAWYAIELRVRIGKEARRSILYLV
jgi:hypothetical protein